MGGLYMLIGNEENNKDTCFVLALLNVPYFASIMFF